MCFEEPLTVGTCWEGGGREDVMQRLLALSECCTAVVPDITAPEDFTITAFPAGVPERCEVAIVRRENGAIYFNFEQGDPDRWLLIFDPNASNARLPGEIISYAGTSAPAGWLFCAGQAVSRTTYAVLFNVIGTTYGAGDGTTTFNLPDLRGRVSAGRDNMNGTAANRITGGAADSVGQAGGAESHTLTSGQMPSHRHNVRGRGNVVGSSGSMNNLFLGTGNSYTNQPQDTNFNVEMLSQTGGGNAHNNLQPFLVLNYIIKF